MDSYPSANTGGNGAQNVTFAISGMLAGRNSPDCVCKANKTHAHTARDGGRSIRSSEESVDGGDCARAQEINYALINYIESLKRFITGVIDLISPLTF